MQTINPAAAIPDNLPIYHDAWNGLVDEFRRNRPLTAKSRNSALWQHPWKASASYDAENKRWTYQILPGFVNGDSAEITLDWEDIPQVSKNRIGESEKSSRHEIPLTERPQIPITPNHFRRIGIDSSPFKVEGDQSQGRFSFESVPNFFRDKGVGEQPVIEYTESGRPVTQISGVLDGGEDEPRLLRAVEVILTKERPALTVDTSVSSGIDGTGFTNYNVRYSTRNPRSTPYLSTRSSFIPRSSPMTAEMVLSGVFEDLPFDDLHVATIYLVSLPGQKPNSIPDETWTPYCQNHLYWNLQYEHTRLQVSEDSGPIGLGLGSGLAGGVATLNINLELSNLNDRLNIIEEFLLNNRVEGRYWTT